MHLINDTESLLEMRQELSALSITAIGVSFKESDASRSSAKKQVPTTIALGVWTQGFNFICYVIDLRCCSPCEVSPVFSALNTLWIVHDVKPLLLWLFSLKVDPRLFGFYDTKLAATALAMGKTSLEKGQRDDFLSLEKQCQHYQLETLSSQSSLSAVEVGSLTNQKGFQESATRVELTVRLYVAQQKELVHSSLQAHLYKIEFPYAIANARIEFNGCPVSEAKLKAVRQSCCDAMNYYEKELLSFGITRPQGLNDVQEVMNKLNTEKTVPKFKQGESSFTLDELKSYYHLHPAIQLLHRYLRYKSVWQDTRNYKTDDQGRVYPCHRQLGTATGRNSCHQPNLSGIGKIFRPLVQAPLGRGIIELDYGQMEVGVLAGESNDQGLIDAYNEGDIYDNFGVSYYGINYTREDMRTKMKETVLSIINNKQAKGLAQALGVTLEEATALKKGFFLCFPMAQSLLDGYSQIGQIKGYASSMTGLRRNIDDSSELSSYRKSNIYRNTPLQASAAVIFKKAVIELDHCFVSTSTQIILPMHDAVVIECDLEEIETVSRESAAIMKAAFRFFYPKLQPKVTIENSQPQCWNKDGCSDSIEQFCINPEFELSYNTINH
jgi:DNA polymerase-1